MYDKSESAAVSFAMVGRCRPDVVAHKVIRLLKKQRRTMFFMELAMIRN